MLYSKYSSSRVWDLWPLVSGLKGSSPAGHGILLVKLHDLVVFIHESKDRSVDGYISSQNELVFVANYKFRVHFMAHLLS